MKNIYDCCPVLENADFRLRLLEKADAEALFAVYNDKNAVPFFNADSCNGGFYFTEMQTMTDCIAAWLREYDNHGFVRMSIVDKAKNEVVGTIEAYHRDRNDFFTNACLLRIDVRSDYEKAEVIESIISLIDPLFFEAFDCDKIVTKAFPEGKERLSALSKCGYAVSDEELFGFDSKYYKDYAVRLK